MEIKGSITLSHCALFAYNTERPRAVKTFLDLRLGVVGVAACVSSCSPFTTRILVCRERERERAMLLWSEDEAEILEYFTFCAQLRRATHITPAGYRYALCACVRRRLYFLDGWCLYWIWITKSDGDERVGEMKIEQYARVIALSACVRACVCVSLCALPN